MPTKFICIENGDSYVAPKGYSFVKDCNVDSQCYDKNVFYYHRSFSNKKPSERINMRLARIDDKYMFKGHQNSKKSHLYCVYTDPYTKEDKVIGTTHLYVPDGKRFSSVKSNKIYKSYFPHFNTVSGVNPYFFNKFYDEKPIDLKDKSKIHYLDSQFFPGEKQAEYILSRSNNVCGNPHSGNPSGQNPVSN